MNPNHQTLLMAIYDTFSCQNAPNFDVLLFIETNSTVEFYLCIKNWGQKTFLDCQWQVSWLPGPPVLPRSVHEMLYFVDIYWEKCFLCSRPTW